MGYDELLRECIVITCFLENINTSDRARMDKLIKGLSEYTLDELKNYYDINTEIKNIRLNRILGKL